MNDLSSAKNTFSSKVAYCHSTFCEKVWFLFLDSNHKALDVPLSTRACLWPSPGCLVFGQ